MRNICRFFVLLCLIGYVYKCDSQTVIPLEKDGGVYKVPCIVNGLRLKLIFDTGASNVCISQTVASMMLENDYLSVNDIMGSSQSQVADGRIVGNTRINLKKIQIGDKVLTNVEAVVIHGQTAPLLLGQSALKRLGRYSISGENLILGEYTNLSTKNSQTNLSDEAIDQLFKDARDAFKANAFYLALEKYIILNDNGLLSIYGKVLLADCYYFTGNDEKARSVYMSLQSDMESDTSVDVNDLTYLYFQIGRCLQNLGDFDGAILYLEKAKMKTPPFCDNQKRAVIILSECYIKKGEEYRAAHLLDEYIGQYLTYKRIQATDCWDRGIKDEFLADLYYERSLSFLNSTSNYCKYLLIAAAWGSKKAIEGCREFGINYSSKPRNYIY